MSPPQQPSLTTAAVSTVPSSSSAHASSPVTVTHSVTVTVVPTLPSPTTEKFTTKAEQKLPTTIADAPSVEMPVVLPSVVAPVAGSGSTETLTIKVEEKLTPVTAAPTPVTATPVPKGSDCSTIVVTMAVNVDKMMWTMWLGTLMFVALTIPFFDQLESLPKDTSTKTKENIMFSICCSMMCFCSSLYVIVILKTALLLSINQSNIVFRFIMMLLVVTFLFGFCFLFTACYLICVEASAC